MEPWVQRARAGDTRPFRLFCFPCAGGSALSYREWQNGLPGDVEALAVELPGRGRRSAEEPFLELREAVQTTLLALLPIFKEGPYALFGHSMGALIAFELERLLERNCALTANGLFVVGARAPHLFTSGREMWNLSDPQLVEELRRLGGTPPTLLDHPSSRQWLLSIIRADFRLLETYEFEQDLPLCCPIVAMRGIADDEVTGEQLRAWRLQTCATFSHRTLEGNHFCVRDSQKVILENIRIALKGSQTASKLTKDK